LEITGGGNVFSRDSGGFFIGDFVGRDAGSTGLVTVEGDGSIWTSDLDVNIGYQGDGTLEITG
jgi:T5SS/PEP-CTERM-associated repeat protein